ncbi:GIY-YIG nuclease family protein [Sphingomonas sp. NPDC019816]|uniref:GIY-YIG nuclease family protein n=1 Tax=Sphingomonas sp. NPDC019816 TaxID=3390679 RepID=UPI003D05D5FF
MMSLLKNPWDELFLCKCCTDKLAQIERLRSDEEARSVQPQSATADRLVYFIGGTDGPVKIGSSANPSARLKEVQTGSFRALSILAVCPGGFTQERVYHHRFADDRLHGEWFARTPALEAEIASLSRLNKEQAA